MKANIQIVFFSCLFFISIVNAQEKKVVAVDGYFTNKDSIYVINHLGPDFIEKIVNIPPDSAQVLIGEIGKFGITNIITINPRDNKSKYFQTKDNLLFEIEPACFVNNKEVDKTVMSSLDPSTIISLNIISQLRSAQLYGEEKKFGVISIKTR